MSAAKYPIWSGLRGHSQRISNHTGGRSPAGQLGERPLTSATRRFPVAAGPAPVESGIGSSETDQIVVGLDDSPSGSRRSTGPQPGLDARRIGCKPSTCSAGPRVSYRRTTPPRQGDI
jgi:hypothetical protein